MFDDDDDDDDSGEVRVLHGVAIGTGEVPPKKLCDALDAVLRARGAIPEEELREPGPGILVEGAVHGFEVHGAWIVVEGEHEVPMSIARELAKNLKRSLTVHTLVVREEVVEIKGREDEWGYRNQYRSLEVRPDGTTAARDSPVDPEYATTAHGDFDETAGAILWAMVTEQDAYSPTRAPVPFAYLLPPSKIAGVPPRVAELAELVTEAGGYSVQQVGGQTMVKLQLPDGSRRFSRVSADELQMLRDATGLEPQP